MAESLGDAAQTRKIIEQTVSAIHEIEGKERDFVTRSELRMEMTSLEQRLEIKLENAMLKTRNWVLGGIIASSIMFGGGFLTMLLQFNRTADVVIAMQKTLEHRRAWSFESDERDRRQDQAIKELKPTYQTEPYKTMIP